MFIPNISVDPKLRPYFDSYQNILHNNCRAGQYVEPRNLDITFDDLQWPTIGMCSYNYFGTHHIQIDKTFWFWASLVDRRNVMWHEQTHCFFHVGHVKDPKNYMAPYITHINEQELTNQVNTFMKEKCK